jgi:hypothetical protein
MPHDCIVGNAVCFYPLLTIVSVGLVLAVLTLILSR